MTITVHEAQVTTAAVEIKTITVRGKQVTLALFRQLKEEPLVNDEGQFVGTAWGVVNYHPGKCAEERVHLHVVWQKGDELRRARLDDPKDEGPFWPEQGDEYLQLLYNWEERKWWSPSGKETAESACWAYPSPPEGLFVTRGRALFDIEGLRCAGYPPEREDKMTFEEMAHLEGLRQDILYSLSQQALHEQVIRQRRRHRWDEVMALPQLFIAT